MHVEIVMKLSIWTLKNTFSVYKRSSELSKVLETVSSCSCFVFSLYIISVANSYKMYVHNLIFNQLEKNMPVCMTKVNAFFSFLIKNAFLTKHAYLFAD